MCSCCIQLSTWKAALRHETAALIPADRKSCEETCRQMNSLIVFFLGMSKLGLLPKVVRHGFHHPSVRSQIPEWAGLSGLLLLLFHCSCPAQSFTDSLANGYSSNYWALYTTTSLFTVATNGGDLTFSKPAGESTAIINTRHWLRCWLPGVILACRLILPMPVSPWTADDSRSCSTAISHPMPIAIRARHRSTPRSTRA